MAGNGRIPPGLRRLREIHKEQLPVFLWLGAASLSVVLLASRARNHEIGGPARPLPLEASAPRPKTVEVLLARPSDEEQLWPISIAVSPRPLTPGAAVVK